jgi:hypothetical protein
MCACKSPFKYGRLKPSSCNKLQHGSMPLLTLSNDRQSSRRPCVLLSNFSSRLCDRSSIRSDTNPASRKKHTLVKSGKKQDHVQRQFPNTAFLSLNSSCTKYKYNRNSGRGNLRIKLYPFFLFTYAFLRLFLCILDVHLSNFVVEWLTLLPRIREVHASNLGSETGYPDSGFSWFYSVLQANARIVPKN